MPAIPRPYRKPRLPRNLGVARRSALDCSRLAAAGALRSRGRAWPAPATARARRRPWAWGTGSGGRGGRRWNVGELEGGAGPLGGADGGHRGGRAYEAAAGPAGRCHVPAPSGPRGGGGLGPGVRLRVAPLPPRLSFLSSRLSRGGETAPWGIREVGAVVPGALGRPRPRPAGVEALVRLPPSLAFGNWEIYLYGG